jgi:hypothetical protein
MIVEAGNESMKRGRAGGGSKFKVERETEGRLYTNDKLVGRILFSP